MILRDKIAARHSRRHVGDIANLACQVRSHEVHVVGEIFPRSGHARHFRLAAQLAFRPDLASHAADFARERIELIHHRVDRVLQLQDFSLHLHRDLAAQIAASHSRRHVRDITNLRRQIVRHGVDVIRQILPGSGHAANLRLAAQLAFRADFASHARNFRCKRVKLIHHRVERILQLKNFALHVDRDLLRKIAVRHRGRHVSDVSNLACQVRSHPVHVIRQILPSASDARDLGLSSELALGPHFARYAAHLPREPVQLIHHRVDGVLQFQNFSPDVHRDFLRQDLRWPQP